MLAKIEKAGIKWSVSFNFSSGNMKQFSAFCETVGRCHEPVPSSREPGVWQINEEDIGLFRELEEKYGGSKREKAGGRLASMLSGSTKKITEYEHMGDGMKLSPYFYQKEIIKFCVDTGESLIVAPCGAGKSAILIGTYMELLRAGRINGPGLIVVKASLKTQWHSEVMKFSGLRPSIIRTFKASAHREIAALKRLERRKAAEDKLQKAREAVEAKFMSQFDGDILIANYETLMDEKVRTALHRLKPEFIAADEIHCIKDFSTRRSKCLCEFNDAPVRIGATATPVKRDPQDLFGIFRFVKPDLFPSKSWFAGRYVRFGGYGRVIGSRNEKELNEKISPYMIIKTKDEISSQLPRLIVAQRHCEFSEKQKAMNDRIMAELDKLHKKEKRIFAKYGGNERLVKQDKEFMEIEASILARQTFAQELADSEALLLDSDSEAAKGYATGDRSEKLELLIELINEITESGEKVCVFSRYRRMQGIITERIRKEPHLKDMGIAYVNGSLSDEQRYHEVYDRFRDDEGCKVLLMSDAGAEGLSLSWCQYLIEYEPAESYAMETQRHGRIERADSTHDTSYVYQLIVNGSYDEIGQKIVAKKEKYDNQIVKGLA